MACFVPIFLLDVKYEKKSINPLTNTLYADIK